MLYACIVYVADVALPLKQAELSETLATLLQDRHTLPEIICNSLTLLSTILSAGTYRLPVTT